MKKVCAWCNKDLGNVPSSGYSDPDTITHGICPDCLRENFAFDSQSLEKFLDQFDHPVLLVDSNGKTISANKKGLSFVHKSLDKVVGKKSGHVFECKHAEGGCGQTLHCKSCTIRNTIKKTFESGKSATNIPAYPDLHLITEEDQVRFFISTEKKGNIVILSITEKTEE